MLRAVIASSKASTDPPGARQMGVASIVFSSIGLALGIIGIIVVVVLWAVGIGIAASYDYNPVIHLFHTVDC